MDTKTYKELKQKVDELEKMLNGGKGSGNFGHYGRPGEVGGSGNMRVRFSESAKIAFTKYPEREKEFNKIVDDCVKNGLSRNFTLTTNPADVMQEGESILEFSSYNGRARTDTDKSETIVYVKSSLFEPTSGGHKAQWAKDGKVGTVDSTFEGVLRHELGHVFVTQLYLKEEKPKGDLSAIGFEDFNKKLFRASGAKSEFAGGKWSYYAGVNNGESIAEAFSNPDYSEDTRKVYDYVRAYKPQPKKSNAATKDTSFYTCVGYPKDQAELDKILARKRKNTYKILESKANFLKKLLNGGPGSGNFGHAGRPGKVGGSSKDSFSSPMRTKGFCEGDIVEIITDDGKKVQGEYKMSARISSGLKMATIKGEDGEIYTVPFRSDRVKMIRNVDAPDTTPAQRRTKKQKEALSEVFGILNTDAKTQKYLLNNCGEDTAIALRDELKKAQEEGVDFSNIGLERMKSGRNRAQVRTAIHSEYDGVRTNYKAVVTLMLSSGLVAGGKNYEASLKKEYDKGEKNTDTIAAVIAHEIGHIRANNLVARLTNGNYSSSDYNRVNRLVTDKALKATKLNFYDAGEKISQYALENRSEMLAESFAKPNKSNLTKAVVEAYNNFTQDDWGHTMNKVRKSEIIREFDLCTGVPIDELELDIIE